MCPYKRYETIVHMNLNRCCPSEGLFPLQDEIFAVRIVRVGVTKILNEVLEI